MATLLAHVIPIGLALLVLTACGDVNVSDPQGDKKEDGKGEDLGDEHGDDSGNEPAAAADEPEKYLGNNNHNRAAVDVEVDVRVKVTVDGSESTALEPVYRPRMLAWAEAKSAAPKGMRLATRSELVALVDAGAFLELELDGLGAWSATEGDDPRDAFFIDLEDGRTVAGDKGLKLPAVYVAGEE